MRKLLRLFLIIFAVLAGMWFIFILLPSLFVKTPTAAISSSIKENSSQLYVNCWVNDTPESICTIGDIEYQMSGIYGALERELENRIYETAVVQAGRSMPVEDVMNISEFLADKKIPVRVGTF